MELLLIAHMLLFAFAGPSWAAEYDYTQQGTDWTVAKDPTWQCLATTSTKQSPIDFVPATAAVDIAPPVFRIASTGGYQSFKLNQNLHTLRVTPIGTAADSIELDTVPYLLQYYDVRAGAEHHINGIQHDVELQYVFQNASAARVVLSFFVSATVQVSSVFIPMFQALAESDFNNSTLKEIDTFDTRYDNLEELMLATTVDNDSLYTYEGSSTEPPCEENIRWFFFPKVIGAYQSYVDGMTDRVLYAGTNGNYRALPTGDLISGIALQKYSTYTTGFTSGAASLSLEVSFVTTMLFAMAW